MSTPPETRSCSPAADPLDGTHGTASAPSPDFDQQTGHRKMPDTALAGARRLHLARLGLGGGKKVGKAVEFGIRTNMEGRGIGVEQPDRGVVGVSQVRQARMMHHGNLDGHGPDGVAVGFRGGDGRVADDARPAVTVHDIDRNTQLFFHQPGQHAAGGIGAPARAPGDDPGDRSFGIFGPGGVGHDPGSDRKSGDTDAECQNLAKHGFPPLDAFCPARLARWPFGPYPVRRVALQAFPSWISVLRDTVGRGPGVALCAIATFRSVPVCRRHASLSRACDPTRDGASPIHRNAPGIRAFGSQSEISGNRMISSRINSMGIRMMITSRITCTTFRPPIAAEISRHKP